jgi:hypothetical protein
MRRIQLAGGGIDAVAFLRDGQRDNRHLRLAEFLNNRGQRIQLCVQAFVDGADDNRLIAVAPFSSTVNRWSCCEAGSSADRR